MAQKIKRRTIVLNSTDKAQLFAKINMRRAGRRSITGIETNIDGTPFGVVRFWK